MISSEHRQHVGQSPPLSTPSRPTRAPLLRRTFIAWLGLAAPLGLAGVVRGRGLVDRQDDSQATASAQASTPEASGGTVSLGCVGIVARDLPASLAFYRSLGLVIPDDAGGGSDYRLRLPTGQVLFWETYAVVRDFDPSWQPSTGNRRVVLEFGFATAQALDDTYAGLTADGHEGYLAPFTFDNSTVRYALVSDPDGNEIGLRSPAC